MPRAQKLPKSVQLRAGKYQVNINGVSLNVNVAAGDNIVNHIVEQHLYFRLNQRDQPVVVVGMDSRFRWPFFKSLSRYVVLCMPDNYCLVAHIEGKKLPASLKKFLEDRDEKICLVGVKAPHKLCYDIAENTGIKVGEFAARALMKPSLYSNKNLRKVAGQVEVPYDKSIIAGGGVLGKIRKRYWDGLSFSETDLKALVYKSYICCKIGEKLLTRLPAA